MRRSSASIACCMAALCLAAALPAQLRLSVPRPTLASTPSDPMPVWEAYGRGLATLRMDPEAFGQSILYPTSFSSGAVYVQLDNDAPGRLILGPDDFVHFSDPGAQDGFLFPAPRSGRTHGFWTSWSNRFHPDFLAMWLGWIEEDSLLFGAGDLYGPVDLANLDEMLRSPAHPTAEELLRVQLLTTWLSLEAGFLPAHAEIHPSAATDLLGDGPRALHVDPVSRPGITIDRGGVLGDLELAVESGALTAPQIEGLKNLLDAINNGDRAALGRGAVIEPRQVWENFIAQLHERSLTARRSGDPATRQPPGLASIWTCTEGLGLSQSVATKELGLGGEILPEPMRNLARPLRFGLASSIAIGATPRSGLDVVRIDLGGETHVREVSYDPSEEAEDQFRRFIAEITRGTGLQAHIQQVSLLTVDALYAVVSAPIPWRLANVEVAGPFPWFRPAPLAPGDHAWATYGLQLQYRIWLHLDANPAVVVGRTPLVGSSPAQIAVRATNLGRRPTTAVRIVEQLPPGVEVDTFQPPPSSRSGSAATGWTLVWDLPPLDGSEAGGVHASHEVRYRLTKVAFGPLRLPPARARWNGQESLSTPSIVEP